MKEINPADVPQMMKDGVLEFGMELEFSCSNKFSPEYAIICKSEFTGFSAIHLLGKSQFEDKHGNWWPFARFPEPKRPDLRDGDPVMVGYKNSGNLFRRIFKEWGGNGQMVTWSDGLSRWTTRISVTWEYGRPATKQELLSKGYTEAQVDEILTRWGVIHEHVTTTYSADNYDPTCENYCDKTNGTTRVG